jgi:hypothetical protein
MFLSIENTGSDAAGRRRKLLAVFGECHGCGTAAVCGARCAAAISDHPLRSIRKTRPFISGMPSSAGCWRGHTMPIASMGPSSSNRGSGSTRTSCSNRTPQEHNTLWKRADACGPEHNVATSMRSVVIDTGQNRCRRVKACQSGTLHRAELGTVRGADMVGTRARPC